MDQSFAINLKGRGKEDLENSLSSIAFSVLESLCPRKFTSLYHAELGMIVFHLISNFRSQNCFLLNSDYFWTF